MPVQNCALLKGIKVISEELPGGSYHLGSRFAPSICRSIVAETGHDILWGNAEQEIEMIIQAHARRVIGRSILLKGVRLIWEGHDDEDEPFPIRRTNVKALYLLGREKDVASSAKGELRKKIREHCRIGENETDGTYLVCKNISAADWDSIMVDISIGSLPLVSEHAEGDW